MIMGAPDNGDWRGLIVLPWEFPLKMTWETAKLDIMLLVLEKSLLKDPFHEVKRKRDKKEGTTLTGSVHVKPRKPTEQVVHGMKSNTYLDCNPRRLGYGRNNTPDPCFKCSLEYNIGCERGGSSVRHLHNQAKDSNLQAFGTDVEVRIVGVEYFVMQIQWRGRHGTRHGPLFVLFMILSLVFFGSSVVIYFFVSFGVIDHMMDGYWLAIVS